MDQPLSLLEIKKRVRSAFISLSVQQLFLRGLAFISINVVLAKILPVETLGIFNIATSIVTFFAFFSDVGLAAALVQKKEKVEPKDIATVFTIQVVIVGVLSLAIVAGAPMVGKFYGLGDDGIWLVRVLGVTFFLSSLKVIPAVLLERELKFKRLVLVEVIESLTFNILLILLVMMNFAIWSFSIAAFIKSILGVTTIYLLSPVKVGLSVDQTAAKKLLSFGIPFQLNVFLALLKDRLLPLLVAKMIGATGVGYVTWSQSLAFLPLEVMNIIIKITFPAFSRLQDDKIALGRALEKSLFITTLFSYPILFGSAAILPSLVTHVVSSKWQPAMFSFYFFAVNIFWAIISTTFTNTLNAMGRIKTTLKLMVFWTILTWVLTPVFVFLYGFNGVAITSFLISFTSVITIVLIKKVLVVKLMDAILIPTVSSFFMSILVFLFAQNFVKDGISLTIAILLGVFVYSLLVFILGRKKILESLRSLKNV